MSLSTPPSLGLIISNALARKVIYGTYIVALIATGAVQVAYASIQLASPNWLTAALAVLAYLGIPVSGLALVNTSTALPAIVTSSNVFYTSTPGGPVTASAPVSDVLAAGETVAPVIPPTVG